MSSNVRYWPIVAMETKLLQFAHTETDAKLAAASFFVYGARPVIVASDIATQFGARPCSRMSP